MTKLIETHPELEELINEYKTETVAEEALRMLEPIPEDDWCICHFLNEQGKSCALGHWVKIKTGFLDSCIGDRYNQSLRIASVGFLQNMDISKVNNGHHESYKQPTPKQRTIALLNDMIKAGY
jgi:hypothetical protein